MNEICFNPACDIIVQDKEKVMCDECYSEVKGFLKDIFGMPIE